MRLGTGFILAACGAAAVAVILLLTGATGKGDGPTPTPTSTSECNAAVFGKVVRTDGKPIPQAEVTVTGPFKDADVAASRYYGTTNDEGLYLIGGLPIGGDYEVRVDAWGLVPSHLVGFSRGQSGSAPEVKCEPTKVDDIVMKTLEQFTQASGTDGYVYGKGVEREDVCRVLISHNLIAACDEITEPVAIQKTGAGWTTFVRDGQSISTKPANYNNEPFWEVHLKVPRPDGLVVLYVQRKCGNVSAPGPIPPPLPPPPGKEVTPTATPTRTPTGSTPTPTATKTPIVPTNTPVTPSATPPQTPEATPTQPVCLTCPPVYGEPTSGPVVATATKAPIVNPTPTVEPPDEPPPPTATKPAGHPTVVP